MSENVAVDVQIDDVKKKLEIIVKQRQYNFMHPDVIEISQQLDDLILQMMKKPIL